MKSLIINAHESKTLSTIMNRSKNDLTEFL